MIGITFKVPNKYDKIFKKILSSIDITKYCWFNYENDDQVFKEDMSKEDEFLFDKSFYSGYDFKTKINEGNYYAVFVKLQAQFSDILQEVNSYDDYVRNDCEMLIIIIDNIFVEIYAKDKNILEIIMNNAVANDYTDIKIITDIKDFNAKT